MDANGKKIPEELSEALVDALQEICLWVHKDSGADGVLLEVKHISMAPIGAGTTNIRCAVSVGGRSQSNSRSMVEDVVKDAMKRAKEKRDDTGKTGG